MDMNAEKRKPRKRFWKRQFSATPTRPQFVYDLLFGIIAPILCFWFDPIFFQNVLDTNNGLLGRYKLIVYFFSGIAIITLIFWLLYGIRLKRYAGFISGILFSGYLFSGSIGLIILPFSLIGFFYFLIGFLGFIPFFTAFTYGRNSFRAFQQAKLGSSNHSFATSFLLGAVLVCIIPTATDLILAHWVESSMEIVISKDSTPNAKEESLLRIKRFYWYVDTDKMRSNYFSEKDEDRKENLAKAFFAATNRNINGSD